MSLNPFAAVMVSAVIMFFVVSVVPIALAQTPQPVADAVLVEEVRGLRRDFANLRQTVTSMAAWAGGFAGALIIGKSGKARTIAASVAETLSREQESKNNAPHQ